MIRPLRESFAFLRPEERLVRVLPTFLTSNMDGALTSNQSFLVKGSTTFLLIPFFPFDNLLFFPTAMIELVGSEKFPLVRDLCVERNSLTIPSAKRKAGSKSHRELQHACHAREANFCGMARTGTVSDRGSIIFLYWFRGSRIEGHLDSRGSFVP